MKRQPTLHKTGMVRPAPKLKRTLNILDALNMVYQYPFLQPIYEGEIIKVVSRPCYLVVTELQRYGLSKKDKPFPIKYAVSKSGQYIGTPRDAWRLVNVAGISVFERRNPTSKVCSIGYCLHKKKWYGWSHRAIFGFKKKEDARRFAASVS